MRAIERWRSKALQAVLPVPPYAYWIRAFARMTVLTVLAAICGRYCTLTHEDKASSNRRFHQGNTFFLRNVSYQVKQTVAAREGGKSSTQNMSDTSTWVHAGKRWQCVLHTESEMQAKPAKQ